MTPNDGYLPRPGEIDRILIRAAYRRLRRAAGAVASLFVLSTAGTTLVPAAAPIVRFVRPDGPPYHVAMPPVPRPRVPAATEPPARPPEAPPGTAHPATPGEPAAVPAPPPCDPRANGGATDRGVTATSIRLGTTVIESGDRAAEYAGVRAAIEAVADEVNRAGGICGRTLHVRLADDGGDPERGYTLLGEMINDGILAIPVAPSSEGLRLLQRMGVLARSRTPVVGAEAAWSEEAARAGRAHRVWPVTTTLSTAGRILAADAYQRGARSFGVVFDLWHTEAAVAFNAEVRRLTGRDVEGFNPYGGCSRRYCETTARMDPTIVETFYKERPDFVAVLARGDAALDWLRNATMPERRWADELVPRRGHAGLSDLLATDFRERCGWACDGLTVWSDFRVAAAAPDPALTAYLAAMERAGVDPYNRHTLAAYAGMKLLVAALRATGADLTRDRLADVLGGETLRVDLAVQRELRFRPRDHVGNVTMQAFVYDGPGAPRPERVRRDFAY